MTDAHYNELERALMSEMRLKKVYEGFTDCIYYGTSQCKALLVQNCRVHNKCRNYKKNKHQAHGTFAK